MLSTYLEPIGGGFVYFVIVAALLWLPYTVWQYRRRGSVSTRRLVAQSLFALYLLVAWALVLLPFPGSSEVACVRDVGFNLSPFLWVPETQSHYATGGLSALLTSPPFVIRAFNVLLTIPFGVFLRRWFGWSLPKTVLAGLLLSMAFEVTQLTGNWGMYDCAYRSFDVDDLIANTSGAVLGWFVAPAMFFVPQRQAADAARASDPLSSLPRRFIAMLVDMLAWTLLVGLMIIGALIVSGASEQQVNPRTIQVGIVLTWLMLQVVLPWLASGSTLGYAAVRIRVQRQDGARPGLVTMLVRFLVIWGPIAMGTGLLASPNSQPVQMLWLAGGLLWWLILAVTARFRKDRATIADLITHTRLVTGNPPDAPLPTAADVKVHV